jgi:hypothetical protein
MPGPSSVTGVSWRHSDVGVAAIVIAIAAVAFAYTFTFDKVPEALMQGLGAEIFPRLVLATIGILAVILAFQARNRTPEALETIHPMVYATTATMIAFFGGVWLIGMLPSMFIYLVGVGWLWGERRLVPLIASATGMCFFIWLVFIKLFGIVLPHSVLSEYFL